MFDAILHPITLPATQPSHPLQFFAFHHRRFAIGGFIAPEENQSFLGSILVGYGAGQTFLYAGRVSVGISQATWQALHDRLVKWQTPECPFANLPTKRRAAFGHGVSVSDMVQCTWLEPRVYCQVNFVDWTPDKFLRGPIFQGCAR